MTKFEKYKSFNINDDDSHPLPNLIFIGYSPVLALLSGITNTDTEVFNLDGSSGDCNGANSLPDMDEYHYNHRALVLLDKHLYVMGGKLSTYNTLSKFTSTTEIVN